MTFGYWHDQAQRGLAAAADAVQGGEVVSSEDIGYAIVARSQVYRRLARVTELLLGYRPVAELPSRGGAEMLFARRGQSLSRFYVGLCLAAETSETGRPDKAAPGPGKAINQAAEAIAVMSDIVASHAPFGRAPRSPEGMAIRAGGGVSAGLRGVARLAAQAERFDQRFARWIDEAAPVAEDFRADRDVARWSGSGRISAAARELMSEVPASPALWDLDVAPAAAMAPSGALAVGTAGEAAAALDSARIWMWRTSREVTVAHLQVSTQLGLALQLAGGGSDPQMTRGWRRAAIAATKLQGTPPLDASGRAVIEQVVEVLRWVRGPADAEVAPRRADFAQLNAKLPELAATVDKGLRSAVRRRDLFVKGDSVLVRVPGKVTYEAVSRWRPARSEDELVREVGAGLRQIHTPTTDTASARASVAALAFVQPRSGQAEQGGAAVPRHVPGRGRQVEPLER